MEVALESCAVEAEPEAARRAMVRRREEEAPAGSQHSTHLGQEAEPVLHVLEHLPRPHDIETRIGKRQLLPTDNELELRKPSPSPPQRHLRHIAPDRGNAKPCERSGEVPHPATEVEDGLSGQDLGEEEIAPEHEVLRSTFRRRVEPVEVRAVAQNAPRP